MEQAVRVARFIVWIALCSSISVAQVEKDSPAPTILISSEVKLLPMPGFGWDGNAQCDRAGNLYFHAVKRANDSLILKLSADGTYSLYTLSAQDAADTWYLGFRATGDGKLWVLAHGNKNGIFLFKFGSDGTVSPLRTQLDVPENLDVQNFFVLQNGHILLQGYYDQNAPHKLRGHGYLAELDASGSLVKASEGKLRPADFSRDIVAQAIDAPAAQTDDGQIYLLAGGEIQVFSPGGQAIKRFPVKLPDFTAFNIYGDGGRLAVTYVKKDDARGPVKARYALFDASNGNRLGVYEPGKEMGNNLVCYSSRGFQFYRVAAGRVQLITASP